MNCAWWQSCIPGDTLSGSELQFELYFALVIGAFMGAGIMFLLLAPLFRGPHPTKGGSE